MTRKEQIKAILDEYDNYDDFIIGGNVSDEVIEKLAALPIDVPGDEEIEDESLNGQINFYDSKFLSWLNDEEQHIFITSAKWMRDEIIKRNRP